MGAPEKGTEAGKPDQPHHDDKHGILGAVYDAWDFVKDHKVETGLAVTAVAATAAIAYFKPLNLLFSPSKLMLSGEQAAVARMLEAQTGTLSATARALPGASINSGFFNPVTSEQLTGVMRGLSLLGRGMNTNSAESAILKVYGKQK